MSKLAANQISEGIGVALTCLFCACAATFWSVSTAAAAAAPEFSPNSSVGWIALGGQFIPPPRGAGPITDDPAHPRVTNEDFRLTGKQPTFPIADLNNPILQPWAREELKKRNDAILSGKPAYTRPASCWPIGV